MTDFFHGMTQRPHPISTGSCDLPILYRDGSMASIMYRVTPDAAELALEGSGLEPMVIGGRVLAVLALFEYRDSTVGVYNELGIGVHAKRPGTRPRVGRVLTSQMRDEEDQGLAVLTLPVTTQDACTAGIELWGYPKYVTGIDVRFEAKRTRCVLEGELDIDLHRSVGVHTSALPLVTLSDGGRVRTIVEIGSRVRWSLRPRASVAILGDGQSARVARMLELDRTRPLAAFRTQTFRAILPAGVRADQKLEGRGRQLRV